MSDIKKNNGELLSFTLPDSGVKIDLMYADKMFWFSQKQISELFEVTVPTVNYHLKQLSKIIDLQKDSVIRKFLITASDGKNYQTNFYHLDFVITVGMRINSQRANRFKTWSAQKLREYILTKRRTVSQQLPPATSDSNSVMVGDALIHCRLSGRGNTHAIVFLHGNGEDLHIFDPQVRYFSQYYMTVAIDTRGHGQSTRGTAPFNFYTFAADLIAVLDALKIDQAHLVGFSDGAITALHAALIAPERIASMVLLGANYNSKGFRLITRLQIWLVYVWLSITSLFSAKIRKRKEIWGLMVYHPNLSLKEIIRINLPALIITGEHDLVSQRQNDEISQAITGSERLIIPHGNHFWMLKQPEVLNQCVMDFLQKPSSFF